MKTGLLILTLYVLALAACSAPAPECPAALLADADMLTTVEDDAWYYTPQPAGTRVMLYPATATWRDGALWVRARPVDGQYDSWVRAFAGGAWRIQADGGCLWW